MRRYAAIYQGMIPDVRRTPKTNGLGCRTVGRSVGNNGRAKVLKSLIFKTPTEGQMNKVVIDLAPQLIIGSVVFLVLTLYQRSGSYCIPPKVEGHIFRESKLARVFVCSITIVLGIIILSDYRRLCVTDKVGLGVLFLACSIWSIDVCTTRVCLKNGKLYYRRGVRRSIVDMKDISGIKMNSLNTCYNIEVKGQKWVHISRALCGVDALYVYLGKLLKER